MIILNQNVTAQTPFSAPYEGERLISSFSGLQTELPQYSEAVIRSLIDINRGPEGGSMETLGLVRSVKNDQVYNVTSGTIAPSNELFALDLEWEATHPSAEEMPNHLEFKAEWDVRTIASGEGNNILGDNGGFYFEDSNIRIPKVKATKETLAYYGAVLIPENTTVRFPGHEAYPLWKMHVEDNYVRDYIMQENGGGGFYLEYHHDQPHFHMVVNGGGCYLLAKQTGENTFHVTAFELCNGQTVYTKKGAIHCDAALTGDLIVGYTASEDCSTVLLRTKATNEMVQVVFT